MSKLLSSVLAICCIACVILVFSSYTKNEQPSSTNKTILEDNVPQNIIVPELPMNLSFANEAFPMEKFDVMERMDKEILKNTFWHSNTIMLIKRANRYFPTFERILAEEGVPDDFKYLAVAESSLEMAQSPAGARGLWQFMKATGKSYNLRIDNEVDERYHVEKSTRAACQLLKALKAKFGSWTLAAAAYNVGEGSLRKSVANQKAGSFFELNINSETMRYPFRLVAYKEILSNPAKYGFVMNESQKYAPLPLCYDVEVTGAVPSWADWAAQYGMSYRELKVYNPWLRDSKLVNRNSRTYYVKVPR